MKYIFRSMFLPLQLVALILVPFVFIIQISIHYTDRIKLVLGKWYI